MRRMMMTVLVAVFGLSGCDSALFSGDCTLIGCVNGLTVALANPPAGAFAVEVRVPGALVQRRECESVARCGPLFFANVVEVSATIAIVTSGGEVSRDVRPQYSRVRPNGPNCEPTCLHAEVTV